MKPDDVVMVTVADIKGSLPNWPEEVIGEWLVYFANEEDMGWPPPLPYGDHRWGGLLGNRPVLWWSDVTWNLETVDCSFEKLSARTKNLVNEIIDDVRLGTADAVTVRRYRHPFAYIMHNAVFPNPMIAMCISDGLSFLDGHHRMAAFTDLQKMPAEIFEKRKLKKPLVEQDIWIGVHSSGEAPLV